MPSTLIEWESYLQPLRIGARSLGEIPLTPLECEAIGRLMRKKIDQTSFHQATEFFYQKIPLTFAAYLALSAAYNTERRFWGVIQEAMGIKEQNYFFDANADKWHWGKIFLKIVQRYGWEDYSQVNPANPYVTAIRLQGGIPAYSLNDFFDHILLPSIERPDYRELPTAELIPLFLARSTVQQFVDDVVLDYLEFGEQTSLAFFDACRKMALASLNGQPIPDAGELGLSPYVIAAFEQRHETRQQNETGTRFRPPTLTFSPYTPGFDLDLPPQPVDGSGLFRYEWRLESIFSSGSPAIQIERVRLRQAGEHLETRPIRLPIDRPAQEVHVVFIQSPINNPKDYKVLARWALRPFPPPGRSPLLLFRPGSLRPIRWNTHLPATQVWIVFPSNAHINLSGKGEIRDTGAEFFGAWADWQAELWDLSQAEGISLVNSSSNIAYFPVTGGLSELLLSGDNLLTAEKPSEDGPTYLGEPPHLVVPIPFDLKPTAILPRWQFRLETCQASTWSTLKAGNLADLAKTAEVDNSQLKIPLAAALPNNPLGVFLLTLKGPGGMSVMLPFRVCPKFEVEGLRPYILPGENGSESEPIRFHLPAGFQLRTLVQNEGIKVKPEGSDWIVLAAPDVTEIELQLEKGKDRLPITFPLPRLRWAIPQGVEEAALAWRRDPISLSAPALLQMAETAIHVDLPLTTPRRLLLSLDLVDLETNQVLQSSDRPKKERPNQSRWRFPLSPFFDTLRGLQERPLFEFRLKVLDCDAKRDFSVSLLRLKSEMEVHHVRLKHNKDGFRLEWKEDRPLHNRRVRIWAEWPAWADPIEVIIPDSAQGAIQVKKVSLPPSRYRIHFFVAAPWEPVDPFARPPKDSPVVCTAHPQDRLAEVHRLIALSTRPNFPLLFERACLLADLQEQGACRKAIQDCIAIADTAKPMHILAFARWLAQQQPKMLSNLILAQMFKPQVITPLFNQYAAQHALRQEYLSFFLRADHLPVEYTWYVINSETDPVILRHGLRLLIEKRDSQAVQKTIKLVDDGLISEIDAAELLNKDASFSFSAMKKMNPLTTAAEQIFAHLLKLNPGWSGYYLPGFWVETSLGWGQIEQIEVNKGKGWEAKPFGINQDKSVRLMLRMSTVDGPGGILDLAQKQFSSTELTCICKACRKFALKPDQDRLIIYHNCIHHPTVEPKTIREVWNNTQVTYQSQFLPQPPEDVLAEFELRHPVGLNALRAVTGTPAKKGRHTEPRWITPGCWIRTDAGWGRIEAMADAGNGLRVDCFDPTVKVRVQLKVKLHPPEEGSKLDYSDWINVDLFKEKISFLQPGEVRLCTLCSRFMFQDKPGRDALSILNHHRKDTGHFKNPKFKRLVSCTDIPLIHKPVYRYPDDPPKIFA